MAEAFLSGIMFGLGVLVMLCVLIVVAAIIATVTRGGR